MQLVNGKESGTKKKIKVCTENDISIPVRRKELWLFPRGQQNLPIEC